MHRQSGTARSSSGSRVDGNKRTAFLVLVEFVERNGREWADSDRDPDESVAMIEAVAAGTLSEAQLAAWIRSCVT